MRKILFAALMVLAFCVNATAIGWQSVDCDSTSYFYYFHRADSHSPCFQPFWQQWAGVQDSIVSTMNNLDSEKSAPAPQGPVLFSLPDNFMQRPNPEYHTARHDRLEFYVRLPKDATSPVLTCRNVSRLTRADSLSLFLPFNTRNLNDYTVKHFGVKAKFVEIRNPLPPHFHINLNDNPIREKYPWMVIIPVSISILLVLLAFYSQDGYITRILNAVLYHNAFLQRVRERNVNADKSGMLLFINYLLNASLLATVALYRYNYQFSAPFFAALASLLVLLLLVYAVKWIASLALSSLFDCRDVFVLYYRNVSFTMQALGVFLIVLNILSLYVNRQGMHDFFFYATLSGCAVAEFMKIFRLIKIIIDKHFPFFYLFLYLCAVEFLPVLLIVRKLSL